MKHIIATLALLVGFLLSSTVNAQGSPAQGNLSPETVTVVIQITLLPGTKPETAAAAMADMRAMIKKQPGFISSELLTNVNPKNSPTNVHVVRWASMKYWENVYASPDFAKPFAAGSKQYSVTASAFKTAQ